MGRKRKNKSSNSSRPCLQTGRLRDNNDVVVTSITAKQKKIFLQPYIDGLVKLRLQYNNKLPANAYTNTIKTLKDIGVNWITIESLKSKVKRAIKTNVAQVDPQQIVNNTTPPPPGVIGNDTSRSIQTIRKRGGRPIGTTTENKSLIHDCCKAAKDEITDLYYSEYLKAKSEETDKVRLRTFLERVPKGTVGVCSPYL
jgi:hypothetical protein